MIAPRFDAITLYAAMRVAFGDRPNARICTREMEHRAGVTVLIDEVLDPNPYDEDPMRPWVATIDDWALTHPQRAHAEVDVDRYVMHSDGSPVKIAEHARREYGRQILGQA